MSDQPHNPPLPDWPLPDAAVEAALRRAFADGSWGKYHGPNCRELSERLAAMHGCEHVVLTCSGTAAVELALRGLRVGPGDEVILSAYDFEGNFKNVLAVGAKPVLVDVDAVSGQLDTEQLDAARSNQTKAIIASHLHGGVVAMPTVRAFADQHQIAVIEDACQMPGAIVHGRVAGTWGDVGVLSFGGSKLLTAGRGGALITRDADVVQRIRVQTYRGNDAYPLSELQAAVLVPQLDRLAERNQLRAANVARLLALLRDVVGMRCFVEAAGSGDPRRAQGAGDSCRAQGAGDSCRAQGAGDPCRAQAADSQPGFYKLGFWMDPATIGCSRDDFACSLRSSGVALDPGFRALHRIHARSRFRAVNDLPLATLADESVLVLHHPVLLGTNEDLQAIRVAVAQSLRD